MVKVPQWTHRVIVSIVTVSRDNSTVSNQNVCWQSLAVLPCTTLSLAVQQNTIAVSVTDVRVLTINLKLSIVWQTKPISAKGYHKLPIFIFYNKLFYLPIINYVSSEMFTSQHVCLFKCMLYYLFYCLFLLESSSLSLLKVMSCYCNQSSLFTVILFISL